ncbi:MAG: sugar phosphate isomerase/epimerase [Lewinellaceae bacterium]|nr:sugar phosphate isomerase/epimerase [Lewinellaceae bacterium]
MIYHPSRRAFLKNTTVALAGATLPFSTLLNNPAKTKHVGLQLYSLRDDIVKNPVAVLEAVAKMGYREVEPYGFDAGKLFGLSYAEFKNVLQQNGLSMHSTHCALTGMHYDAKADALNDAGKKILDDAASAGLEYAIIPWMSQDERKNIAETVKVIKAAGVYAKKAGIRLGYHNHDFEFTTKGPDGRLLIEWILHEVPADILAMEMDLYWVTFANQDPLDWWRLYPGRWELCHVKDMAKTANRETVEVGDGSIDFARLFRKSKQAGLKYYVVELEQYVTTPLQGVERARKNLMTIL